MKYRKKPVVIDAWPWHAWPELLMGDVWTEVRDGRVVGTLEGDLHASEGDYLIRGVKGEFYPCKPDIFEATYEPVEET